MLKYLKSAFLYHWNLLALCGGLGVAVLSGQADVAIPLVLAVEAAYLGLLSGNPKYQKYVDAKEHKLHRSVSGQRSEQVLNHILARLPSETRERFEQLRDRCLELRGIATDIKQPGASRNRNAAPLDSLQSAGLDRLLWIYLRLLFTEFSLEKFLSKAAPEGLDRDAARLRKKLEQLDAEDKSAHAAKIRHTIEDNLATIQSRVDNLAEARENHQFVQLEIDRLENKIKSLAEVAINRQEPEFISSEVDVVARSMLETEKTMNELDFATGLGTLDEDVPELLQQRRFRATQ